MKENCEYLSKLIASFEELYVWLEVQSVSLIWKQKEGAGGFQDWHIDLANNGQTVFTICVNIGSLDIPVDGKINYPNANTDAYVPDIDVDEGEAKKLYVRDSKCEDEEASLGDKEGVAKSSSIACSLEYSDNDAHIDTIGGDSDNKFWSFFPRDHNSMNYILGGSQKPDMKGMTVAEEQEAKKQWRKARKSFTDKEHLTLMNSMPSKGVATLPQKSQSGNCNGDPNKMV